MEWEKHTRRTFPTVIAPKKSKIGESFIKHDVPNLILCVCVCVFSKKISRKNKKKKECIPLRNSSYVKIDSQKQIIFLENYKDQNERIGKIDRFKRWLHWLSWGN